MSFSATKSVQMEMPDSVSVPTKLKRPRLIRSINEPEFCYKHLFENGCERFCTCGQYCMYMRYQSEKCDKGGDDGEGYQIFYNNQMFSLA